MTILITQIQEYLKKYIKIIFLFLISTLKILNKKNINLFFFNHKKTQMLSTGYIFFILFIMFMR